MVVRWCFPEADVKFSHFLESPCFELVKHFSMNLPWVAEHNAWFS